MAVRLKCSLERYGRVMNALKESGASAAMMQELEDGAVIRHDDNIVSVSVSSENLHDMLTLLSDSVLGSDFNEDMSYQNRVSDKYKDFLEKERAVREERNRRLAFIIDAVRPYASDDTLTATEIAKKINASLPEGEKPVAVMHVGRARKAILQNDDTE